MRKINGFSAQDSGSDRQSKDGQHQELKSPYNGTECRVRVAGHYHWKKRMLGYVDGQGLPWTGERFLPELNGIIRVEHLHRYHYSCQFCRGRSVIDIASGEGYGSSILAKAAYQVVGLEYSASAVAHARGRYQQDNLVFLQGDGQRMPLPSNRFDVAVSFETIEHMDQPELLIGEIKRVLRPGGLAIISTPDLVSYNATYQHENPYHLCEMTENEFRDFLHKYFRYVSIGWQRHLSGSLISLPNENGPDLVTLHKADRSNGIYMIALASDEILLRSENTVYELEQKQEPVVDSTIFSIVGAARVGHVRAGPFDDGFVGRALVFTILAEEPVYSLEIATYRPPAVPFPGSATVIVQGVTRLVARLDGGPYDLRVSDLGGMTGEIEVAVISGGLFTPKALVSCQDERELAFVLGKIAIHTKYG